MKRSTILMRLLSAITIAVVVSDIYLVPWTTSASSTSKEILGSESDGSESKSVNRVLNCKVSVHQHDGECYDSDNNLICGYADFVVHTHEMSCFNEDEVLVCTLPEIEEHTHGEECYGDITDTVGGQDSQTLGTDNNNLGEVEEDDAMVTIIDEPVPIQYSTQKRVPTCGREEIKCHTHTQDCYFEGELICGRTEIIRHQHTEKCFQTDTAEAVNTQSANNENTSQKPTVKTSQTVTIKSIEKTNAQNTEYTEKDQGNLDWAFSVFGTIILILAAAVGCCIIYKSRRV